MYTTLNTITNAGELNLGVPFAKLPCILCENALARFKESPLALLRPRRDPICAGRGNRYGKNHGWK